MLLDELHTSHGRIEQRVHKKAHHEIDEHENQRDRSEKFVGLPIKK